MPAISRIQIPRGFICPITRDVMTDPVQTIFLEDPSKKPKSFLSRIFTSFSSRDFSCCEGHFFERQALDSYLGQNPNCPVCNSRITKVAKDAKIAKKIQNEFVNASEKNKKHFQEAKEEVDRVYKRQNQSTSAPLSERERTSDTIPTPPAPRSFDRTSQLTSDLFNHRAFHSHSLFMRPHPIVITPYSMYRNVLNLISNGKLLEATRKANGIINTYYRNLSYQKIVEKYLSLLYPRFNQSRVKFDIQKAIDLTREITDIQIRNDLYFKIVQRAAEYDYLGLAERIANLIAGNAELKNQSFKEIVNRYFIKFQRDLRETTEQNIVRLINLITDAQIKEPLLNNLIKILIQNNKLKKAQNLNSSLKSNSNIQKNNRLIAKAYIDRKFSNKNLQKALILISKISNVSTRDLLYTNISQKYQLNLSFFLSLKTISKISTFSKRIKLYAKTALKMIIFAISKPLALFSKLATWGYNILLFPFRLIAKLRIYFQKK